MYTVQEYNKETKRNEDQLETMVPILYRVIEKRVENTNLITLVFEPAGEEKIEPLKPGQFNMIYIFGLGEIPISVSSLLAPYPLITHTIQDVGAISHACCELSIEDEVGIRGPFGNPFPVEDAKFKDVIILAGGVGFAPLRPMIEYIAYNRDDYGEVNFLYGTRDPSGILFHQDVISLQSDPSINFQITVDHSYKNWRGNVGVVTSLLDKAEFNPKNTMAFVCGPEIMMRYGTYELIDWEIPEENIFLSMERNMKCALGHCGHCQYGPHFVCKEGPVFSYSSIRKYLNIFEI